MVHRTDEYRFLPVEAASAHKWFGGCYHYDALCHGGRGSAEWNCVPAYSQPSAYIREIVDTIYALAVLIKRTVFYFIF